MKFLKSDLSKCCGCSACLNICPTQAISMQEDQLGFLYPIIDDNKCIECKRCEKVCQFKPNYERYNNFESPIALALRVKNYKELQQSQSGGAFFAYAKYFIEQSGSVYGAAFDSNFQVTHQKAQNFEELTKLRGSKYVQSNLREIFKDVKNDLKGNKKVLFSGTPCQVAGLKAFIPNSLQKNLYTIDLICHSVPGPLIWKKYITWIEHKYKDKIIDIKFRDKNFGWHSNIETFVMKTQKIHRTSFSHFFFYEHLGVRKSCAHCPYTNTKRIGDLTVGDFWGWEKISAKWNDNKGVSLVFINSHKGEKLTQSISQDIKIEKVSLEQCLQPQLLKPITIGNRQDSFIKEFTNKDFSFILKKYADEGIIFKLKNVCHKFKTSLIKHIK